MPHDFQMNVLVDAEIEHALALGEQLHHAVVHCTHADDLGVCRIDAGKLARERLHARNDGQHVARLARLDAAHDRAAIGLDLDQPLDGQHLEGFAQRRARDMQLLAKLLLDDAAAFRQMPLDNEVAQPRRHRLMQRAPRDRSARVGSGDEIGPGIAAESDMSHRIIIGIQQHDRTGTASGSRA